MTFLCSEKGLGRLSPIRQIQRRGAELEFTYLYISSRASARRVKKIFTKQTDCIADLSIKTRLKITDTRCKELDRIILKNSFIKALCEAGGRSDAGVVFDGDTDFIETVFQRCRSLTVICNDSGVDELAERLLNDYGGTFIVSRSFDVLRSCELIFGAPSTEHFGKRVFCTLDSSPNISSIRLPASVRSFVPYGISSYDVAKQLFRLGEKRFYKDITCEKISV